MTGIHSMKFNQDMSCVAIGTSTGFVIYSVDPIEMRFRSECEGIKLVEMLYSSSLIALVASGETPGTSPRKLKLWNSQSKETICEVSFNSTILNIAMNKNRLVVCLESQLHLYELSTMKCLQVLSTMQNPAGIFVLSGDTTNFLAFPSGTSGGVVVYDTSALRLLSQIDAHRSAVQDLQFDRQGSLIATASASGTVVRVFRVPSGEHLCSFRRGSRPTRITSMSFSVNNQYLAVGSNSGTIHVFYIDDGMSGGITNSNPRLSSTDANGSNVSWRDYTAAGLSVAQGWTMSMLGGGLNALPEPIQEFAGSSRAIAYARLPTGALRDGHGYKIAIVPPLTGVDTTLRLVALTESKYLYRFSLVDPFVNSIRQEPRNCALEDEALLE